MGKIDVQEFCHLIVRLYMYGKPWPPQLANRFRAWLADPRHFREKDAALRSVFDEIMDGRADYGGYVTEDYKNQHIN